MRKSVKRPRQPRCRLCNGTGYLDGPKQTRTDSLGRVHSYTSLTPCRCYKACPEVPVTTATSDHAMRAANDGGGA